MHNRRSLQSGAALGVALIMLLLLTLLGLSASRIGILQERMAGNVQETNLAFQRAEETLRDIEQRVRQLSQGGSGGLGGIPLWESANLENGDCTLSDAAWGDWDSAPWRPAPTTGQDTEFLILDLGGSGCTPMHEQQTPLGHYYLIAVRAEGDVASTQTIVQSIFFWP